MPSRWLAGLGPGCEIRANATTATCATATTGATTVTSAPVSVSVVAPPVGRTTIEIAQPADGATLYTLTPTHVMPSITTAPGFSVLRVNYYADGVQFAYRTKAPYYAHVRFLVTGTYALTVEVIDSGGYKSVSSPVTVTIVDGTPSVVYYHNDASGSPVAASDQAGSLVWLEAYRPWGERVLGDDAGTKNGIWYAGKPVEDATGLAYLGARWYSPEIGRFYGVDPVAFREEEPKSVNRYAYANNNPYRYVDPDGRSPFDIAFLLWDLKGLAQAVSSGEGVVSALVDVGVSAVGVVAPIPGVGLGIKSVRRADQIADVASAARGAGVIPKPGTRLRPPGVPENWRVRPSDSPGGVKYYDPKNPGNQVRVEQGNPNSPYAASREPYVRDLRDGHYRDAQGNFVLRNDPAGHIPLDQYPGYRP